MSKFIYDIIPPGIKKTVESATREVSKWIKILTIFLKTSKYGSIILIIAVVGFGAILVWAFSPETQTVEIFPTQYEIETGSNINWQNVDKTLQKDLSEQAGLAEFSSENSAVLFEKTSSNNLMPDNLVPEILGTKSEDLEELKQPDEESKTTEPSIEEPAIENPVIEEPAVEEPATEEPEATPSENLEENLIMYRDLFKLAIGGDPEIPMEAPIEDSVDNAQIEATSEPTENPSTENLPTENTPTPIENIQLEEQPQNNEQLESQSSNQGEVLGEEVEQPQIEESASDAEELLNLIEKTEETPSISQSPLINHSIIFSGFNSDPAGKLKGVKFNFSFASEPRGEKDVLVIDYKLNGDWATFMLVKLDKEQSNFLNNGYWQGQIPDIVSWNELNNLKIRFTILTADPDSNSSVYLDAFWLEAEYEAIKKESLKISERKSFRSDEEPEFTTEGVFSEKSGLLKELASLFGKKEITEVTLINPRGEEGSEGIIIENDIIRVKKPDQRSFRPGLYKLKIKAKEDEEEFTKEQEFSWGVLAVNVNKSIYLPGETAYLQITSLNEYGRASCKSKLELKIKNSDTDVEKIFSTESGTIQNSDTCGPNNITDSPDYFAYYEITQPGIYQIRLTNLDTGYEVTDFFEVRENVLFEVERIGATRINPFLSNYKMTLNIKTNQDFNGEIVEKLPSDFEVIDAGGGIVKNNTAEKEIVWKINLKNGQQITLQYEYKAPEISPQIFLLGPMEFKQGDGVVFEEARQWQIAADTAISSTATGGNWNATTSWTGGVVPVAGDDVTIAVNADITVTADAACATLTWAGSQTKSTNHGITINAGFTLDISGAVTYVNPNASSTNRFINVLGTLKAASISMPTTGGNAQDCYLAIGNAGIVTVSGSVTMATTFLRNHINITGAGTINIGGNVNNGSGAEGGGFSFTTAAGVINLNGTAAQSVFLYGGGTALGILSINNTVGVTSAEVMTVTTLTIGNVTGSSIFTDGGFQVTSTGTLNLTSGTFKLGAGTATTFPAFTAGKNISAGTTVEYASSAAQTVLGGPSYKNLTISGASTKTVGTTNLSVGEVLSIGTGATLSMAASTYTLAVTGATTITGTLTGSGSGTKTFSDTVTIGGTFTNSGSGAVTFTKLLTINNGGTFNNSGNTAVSVVAGITNNSTGTFTSGTGVYTINGTQAWSGTLSFTGTDTGASAPVVFGGAYTLTNNGTVSISGDLTGAANCVWINAANSFLTVAKALLSTGTLTANANPNTVTYNGAAGQNVKNTSDGHYNNLTINDSGQTAALGVNTTVDNILTITAGTLNSSTYTLEVTNVTNSGTIRTQNTSAAPLTTGKTWGGTVQYDAAAGGQTIMAGTYNILNNSNTNGTNTVGGNLTVNSTLTTTAGGTMDLGAYTLTFAGTGTVFTNGGTFTASTGTVAYEGTLATTVAALNGNNHYYNLNVGKSTDTGTFSFTAGGEIEASGSVTLVAGSSGVHTFDMGSNNLSVGGGAVNTGGIAVPTRTVFTQTSGTTKVYSASGAATLGGAGTTKFYNFIIGNASDGASYTFNLGGDVGASNSFTLAAGTHTLALSSYEFGLYGDFTLGANASLSAQTGLLTFGGTGNTTYTLNSGLSEPYNLTINKTGTDANDNVTLGTSNLTVRNTLTITDGELTQTTSNVRVEGSSGVSVGALGEWSNLSTGDLVLGGNFANAGSVSFSTNDSGCTNVSDDISISSTNTDLRTWSGTYNLYNITASYQADSSITCKSCTNSGSSSTWIFAGCNSSPTIGEVSLNGKQSFNLLENSQIDISASVSVTDVDNGDCSDISGVKAIVYRYDDYNASCSDDPNNCYDEDRFNCVTDGICVGNTQNYNCYASSSMQFFTDPTDTGTSFSADQWVVTAIASDSYWADVSSSSYDDNDETAVEVNELTALEVTAGNPISYGEVIAGQDTESTNQTTTVKNTGNRGMDVYLYGTNLTGSCGTITMDSQEYKNTTPFAYGSGTDLSGSNVRYMNGSVSWAKPTSATPITNNIYWGIGIPAGMGVGTCSGTDYFSATKDNN